MTAEASLATLINTLHRKQADIDQQEKMIDRLRATLTQSQKKGSELPVGERIKIAQALASVYTDHIEKSREFADIRAFFVDDEVRKTANANRPSPIPFSMERNILDLTHRKPDSNGEAEQQGATRPAQIMDVKGAWNRTKEIAYGPRSAASENLATKMMLVTGHAAPKTQLARYDARPQALASQLIPGFKDLGEVVLDTSRIRPLIEKEWGSAGVQKLELAFKKVSQATEELEVLHKQQPIDTSRDDPITKQKQEAIEARLRARIEIFDMLPAAAQKRATQELKHALADARQKMEKAQFMAQFVADVDFLNYELYNAGFTKEGVPVVLDEGNCLLYGFKGKQKGEDNLRFANARARPTDPFEPNQVMAKDHSFGDTIGASRNNVGATARSVPIALTQKGPIGAETRMAEAGNWKQMSRVPKHEMQALSGQMEGAFQLSLLPDDAIRHVIISNWPAPDDASMPYKDDDKIRPTADELADTLIARRDALVAKFTPDDLTKWEAQNPDKAKAAYNQAAAAIADLSDIYIEARTSPAQEPKADSRPLVKRNSV